MAESKVAFIQNSLKIRSPNSSVGTNPSTVKLLEAILLSRTCVPKIYQYDLYWPLPTLWALLCGIWMQVGYNQKGTYKAGVSYVLACQVHNNSWSSFNTIHTPIPPHSHSRARFWSWDRYTTISTPSPYHTHTIAQSTGQLPLGTVSRPVAPGYDRTLTPWGRREGLISYLV